MNKFRMRGQIFNNNNNNNNKTHLAISEYLELNGKVVKFRKIYFSGHSLFFKKNSHEYTTLEHEEATFVDLE